MFDYYSSEAADFKRKLAQINKVHVLAIVIIGALIIPACSLLQTVPPPRQGEYYYSMFLRNNLTLFASIMLVLAGFIAGYYTTLHPLLIGLLLFLIFPITILIEGTIHRGSHNLLPFELLAVFLLSLPSAMAAFLGRFVCKQRKERNFFGRDIKRCKSSEKF